VMVRLEMAEKAMHPADDQEGRADDDVEAGHSKRLCELFKRPQRRKGGAPLDTCDGFLGPGPVASILPSSSDCWASS
jgi:hypothetical protein